MKRRSDALLGTFQATNVTPPSDNGNSTAGGANGSNSVTPTSTGGKKRNKLIKSCGFCRRRKLRCDQQKPMCSTCISRNLTTCQYADEFNKDIEKKATYGPYPNAELLKKVEDLENKIRILESEKNTNSSASSMYTSPNFPPLDTSVCETSTETSSPLPDGVINPYADRYYLQSKHSGRSVLYGPTSMRTQIANSNWGFIEKYKQLWTKVKAERNKWKQNNQKTMCRELSLLDESNWEPDTLIKQICRFLPSYDKVLSILDDFFSDEACNEINMILDKAKVRRDFLDYFMPEKEVNANGDRSIVYILSNSKNNYYKAAVILLILCLKYFHANVPIPIEKLFTFLNGASTAKVFYVERAQMLILFYYHREIHSFGGDGSHLINLNESLFTTVTTIGLHLNIRETFKDQEIFMGSIESLENVWLMAILIDYSMSCNIGRPLLINKFYLDEKQDYCILNSQSKTYEGKLKRYLRMARPMLFALYDREKFPDLKAFSKQIINFVEEELGPLGHYTDENQSVEVPLRETRIISMAVGLLLSFYALVHSVLKARNIESKNNTFQLVLINFSIIVNTTIRCYRIDKALHPEKFKTSYPHLPPHMALSMSLTAGLFSKTLVFFCSLSYFKLTLFENGICLSNDMEVGWSDLTRMTVPLDKDLSLGTAMRLYSTIFDRLFTAGDKELIRTMHRSPQFVVELAIERTYRTILGNVIEFRKLTEETWLAQIKQELDPQGDHSSPEPKTVSDKQQQQQQDVNLAVPTPTPSIIPMSPTPGENKNHTKSQSEIIQMLTDEFWTNYNSGWEELVNQSEFSTLFDDYEDK
ncbi:Yrr1p [Saccharomyces paradoxus]|uniref:Yrr1p n=1 Tax=Saccharomyces paradoxus TaxID=27291 RepID=A0A8B8UZV6_SACPA|nr:Yrr1 [Saccharomyces paradoxus]QHS76263.1 Yrr1 [Saccharomyces paradoxus]